MNQYEMVALIAAVVVIGGVLKQYLEKRRAEAENGAQEDLPEVDSRFAAIEKRIQVLERIVTSDGYDLKQKFKNLDDS